MKYCHITLQKIIRALRLIKDIQQNPKTHFILQGEKNEYFLSKSRKKTEIIPLTTSIQHRMRSGQLGNKMK